MYISLIIYLVEVLSALLYFCFGFLFSLPQRCTPEFQYQTTAILASSPARDLHFGVLIASRIWHVTSSVTHVDLQRDLESASFPAQSHSGLLESKCFVLGDHVRQS